MALEDPSKMKVLVEVNGIDIGEQTVNANRKKWSFNSKYLARLAFEEHTDDVEVKISVPNSDESRTFLVKGWFEYNQSASEVRSKRVV